MWPVVTDKKRGITPNLFTFYKILNKRVIIVPCVNMKDRKTVHIPKELHQALKVWVDLDDDIHSLEELATDLIKEGLENRHDEIPDIIKNQFDIMKSESKESKD